MKTKYSAVVVIGSSNEERDFSLRAGNRVAQALRTLGWAIKLVDIAAPYHLLDVLSKGGVDAIVPIGFGLHSGEDGSIYTISEMLGLPCAGPGPMCGNLCTDKSVFQLLIAGMFCNVTSMIGGFRIRSPKTVVVKPDMTFDAIAREIGQLKLPLILKPAFGGSSIGIMIAQDHAEATARADAVKVLYGLLLVQEYVRAREISATLIDFPDRLHHCPLVELDRGSSPIMGYEEKFGLSAKSRHIIPTTFPSSTIDVVSEMATRIHSTLRLRGVSRIDALIDDDKAEIVVLEANPIAGMLESSIAVDAAAYDGISFESLAEAYALTAFAPSPTTPALAEPLPSKR